MILRPIETVDGILAWQAQARNDALSCTNLFPDPRKMNDWIERGVVFAVELSNDCRLLVVREECFDRLFYCATGVDSAARDCSAFQNDEKSPCVLDVVGPQPIQDVAKAAFEGSGFRTLKTLTRMRRSKSVESYECLTSAMPQQTTEENAVHIYMALHKFFDARAEQLPCLEEVKQLCTNGSSFVAVQENKVCAFLLGEIQGKKGAIRYWFVTPDGREKGVGGVLMHAFFDYCLEHKASYQELWVLDDNENAIKRYQHYGFIFDCVRDSVFIKGEQI